jgi:hypothetical protein
MKVGDNILEHLDEFKKGREWDQTELVNAIRGLQVVWCWGPQAWTTMNKFALRFKVNGYLHKGHVYLSVNASDLFDVTLTTMRGKIISITTDIYVSELVSTIDGLVERKK